MTEDNNAATEPMPTVTHELDPLAVRKSPNITSLLANHLDWLQYDLTQLDQQIVGFQTRTAIALSEIKTHNRHASLALIAVILGLLVNALLGVGMIYLLGILVGHVK